MRKKTKDYDEIVLGTDIMKCSKCLHVRENEPFLRQVRYLSSGGVAFYYTCWRCCRGAESTFLIMQKWPLAFERSYHSFGYDLNWAPGVAELAGGTDGKES